MVHGPGGGVTESLLTPEISHGVIFDTLILRDGS